MRKVQNIINPKPLLSGLCSMAILLAFSHPVFATGSWTPLTNQLTILNPPSQCAAYPGTANCAPPGVFSYGGILQPLLLTDGSVLFVTVAFDDDFNITEPVYRLFPDKFGNYVNGTWTRAADLPPGYSPFYIGSAVLADGRAIISGGEYDFINCRNNNSNIIQCFDLLNQTAIYDPVANQWTSVPPPSFFPDYTVPHDAEGWFFGDAGFTYSKPIADTATVVLENGKYMVGSKRSKVEALLDPVTLTWTQTGAGKFDINSEEQWTLLPNGKLLTVDCYVDYEVGLLPITQYPLYPDNTHSEIYDPATGHWSSAGSTIVSLTGRDRSIIVNDFNYYAARQAGAPGTPADLCPPNATQGDPNCPSDFNAFLTQALFFEIGPQVLMPNGKVIVFGMTGQNAFYDFNSGKWSVAPSSPIRSINGTPTQLVNGDSGAAVLPNGKVLVQLCADVETTPCYFYEFDGKNFTPTANTPDAATSVSDSTYMTVLPSGQIIQSDNQTDIEIYTPDQKTYNPSWAPVITSVPVMEKTGADYLITGIRFNGMTQGGYFGDDAQMATNYPLVRVTNLKTGHVFYNRTHDHSYMGVASNRPVSTHFTVPMNEEEGPSTLEVVANGIPSIPKLIYVTKSH